MKWSRFAHWMTVLNLILFVVNILGGFCLFFMVGRRPDGVESALHHWLAALWMSGPLWSIAAFVVALIALKKSWQTYLNGALCIAYVLLWALLFVM